MPKSSLIILNGPPASGKSMLAGMYADDHPMTLVLDIDDIRGRISHWQDHSREAGLQARVMAMAMARVHVSKGYDVIVPQAYGVITFLEAWEALAKERGATYFEVMLVLPKEEVMKRYVARGDMKGIGFDPKGIEELTSKIVRVNEVRPHKMIDQSDRTPEESYEALKKLMETNKDL